MNGPVFAWVFMVAVLAMCVGLIIGKELEATGWRSKSRVLFRKASGGRLFKVLDVTPWDAATSQARAAADMYDAATAELPRRKAQS